MASVEIDFGSVMRQSAQGLLIKPLVRNYIQTTSHLSWPGIDGSDLAGRPPDGYFHPSQHPLWPERALYTYLAHPERIEVEHLTYESRLSVTFGSAWHRFEQRVLDELGLRPRELNTCQACPPGRCSSRGEEAGFVDERTGERTHVDAVLALPDRYGMDLWEGKTAAEHTWPAIKRLRALQDLDTDEFRRIYPGYYAQAIRCQHLTGIRRTIVTIGILGNPWEMREFHIDYDAELAEEITARYLDVRQAHADQQPPRCACPRPQRATCPGVAGCP